MTQMPTRWPVGLVLVVALSCTSCTASRHAAKLADATSAHVNALGVELQAFVVSANDSRKTDAQRLASIRVYYRSIEDFAQSDVRAWRANPADARNKNKIAAFEAIQQDAAADMSNAESNLRSQSSLAADMEAKYGQISYDPKQLEAVVAQLQVLSKRSDGKTQLIFAYSFSADVFKDAKAMLAATKLNANGVSQQKLPAH